MTLLLGLPLLAVAAVVQSSLVAHFHFYGGTLDLVCLMALGWTVAGDWEGGLLWGFFGGLFLDLLSGGPLGLNALALVILTYAASLTEGRLWRSHILLPLALAAISTFGLHFISLLGLTVLGQTVNWSVSLLRITLPAAVLNTFVMFPLYSLLRWVQAVVQPAPVKM